MLNCHIQVCEARAGVITAQLHAQTGNKWNEYMPKPKGARALVLYRRCWLRYQVRFLQHSSRRASAPACSHAFSRHHSSHDYVLHVTHDYGISNITLIVTPLASCDAANPATTSS